MCLCVGSCVGWRGDGDADDDADEAGGRVDLFHVSAENTTSGIFIKHVVEHSPAGRSLQLHTGDRILQVRT